VGASELSVIQGSWFIDTSPTPGLVCHDPRRQQNAFKRRGKKCIRILTLIVLSRYDPTRTFHTALLSNVQSTILRNISATGARPAMAESWRHARLSCAAAVRIAAVGRRFALSVSCCSALPAERSGPIEKNLGRRVSGAAIPKNLYSTFRGRTTQSKSSNLLPAPLRLPQSPVP